MFKRKCFIPQDIQNAKATKTKVGYSKGKLRTNVEDSEIRRYLNTFKRHHHWRFHANGRYQWRFQSIKSENAVMTGASLQASALQQGPRACTAVATAAGASKGPRACTAVATAAGASKASSTKAKTLLTMAFSWPRASSSLKAPSELAPCMASYVKKDTPWEILSEES